MRWLHSQQLGKKLRLLELMIKLGIYFIGLILSDRFLVTKKWKENPLILELH